MNNTGEFVIENGILLKYNGDSKEIVIPKAVTKIGDSAFYGCSFLTNITIPECVTSIGEFAFAGASLTSIIIPESVIEIGRGAFSNCVSLTNITIPEGITRIAESTFYNCEGLTNIVIPKTVTIIGDKAFDNCRSLTSITIPDSVRKIGSSAFGCCLNLTSINIPKNVSKIDNVVFGSCKKLKSITIPENVTEIGYNAFIGCESLICITIPESVNKIGYNAFHSCERLESISIPESVTEIGGAAFALCKNLINIKIPKNITKIDDATFAGCESLASITVPKGVLEIGNNAFDNCNNLTSITIPESVRKIGDNVFMGSDKVVICTPKGSYAEQYGKEHNINLKISGSVEYNDINREEFHIDTTICDDDTSSTAYTEYSYGNVYFKLPTGVFEYHGINDCDEARYYGKKHPEHICCDVIISTCDARPMTQYIIYEKCIKDSPVFSTIVRQNKLVVNKGKGSVIETIVNDRTITLWVRAGVCNYFRLTVGQSYDQNVTVSELRDFAYKILDTVTIDDDVKEFKRPVARQGAVEKKEVPVQPQEANNEEKQEGCYIATAVYGDYDDPNVMALRRFRDNYLSERNWGRKFIELYYRYSPRLADKLKNHIVINAIIRKILDSFVKKLGKN